MWVHEFEEGEFARRLEAGRALAQERIRLLPQPRMPTHQHLEDRRTIEGWLRVLVEQVRRSTGLVLTWRVGAYDEWIRETTDWELISLTFEDGFGGRLGVAEFGEPDPDLEFWFVEVGGSGRPFSSVAGAEAFVELASAVQDDVIDELYAEWPVCPGHGHPADPAVMDGRAVWVCPSDNRVVSELGRVGDE